jgi:hypothetical protein
MAGFGFTRENASGVSPADILYAFGGMMAGDQDPVGAMNQRREGRRGKEETRRLLEALMGPGDAAPPAPTMKGPGMGGAPIGPEQAPARPGLPDPQSAARTIIPALLQSQGPKALPQIWQILQGAQPKAAESPHFIEGPDGIYQATAGGVRKVQGYPAAAKPTPPGFMWVGDKLQLIPGYAEGIGQVSGQRRDAIVSRPMPRSSNGHGGSSSGLPPGYVPR